MNLAAKYRPSCFEDVTEQGAVVDILKKICSDSELPNRNFLFIGPAGTGKAQPLYSKVLTPKGFITMGEVETGTRVIDGDGFTTKVTDVFPQGKRTCYRITFDDNSSIDVADNHLNVVTEFDFVKGTLSKKIMETTDLLQPVNNDTTKLYFVPIGKVDYSDRGYGSFLDTFFLGAFAVSGYMNDNEIIFNDLPIESLIRINSVLLTDWNCQLSYFVEDQTKKYKVVETVESAKDELIRELKTYFPELLCDDPYLPDKCLICSSAHRQRLLEGLRVGSYDCSFVTDNEVLSQQYTEVANSLGLKDVIIKKEQSYKDTELKTFYFHDTKNDSDAARKIISIQEIGKVDCKCIMVGSPCHTYITDNYTVTHNTTLGRIISRHLNGGPNGVIEIDAASHSGADAARDITNQARAYPVGTAWKCFLIDECHSISSQGWQVLLKTLEESPAKSIFILCTTNPEKIPATILSRVQTFRLSKISVEGIASRLKYICDAEIKEGSELNYDEKALLYIAKLGNGGMRDSIQLLDRAIAYSKDVNVKNLAVALDLPNYDTYFELLNGIAKKNNEEIVRIINDVYDSGTNFVRWFEGFHSFVCQIIKYIFLKDISKTMIPEYYQEKISGYGANHALLCLKLANTLLKLNHELKTTNYLQEVAITFLCAPVKKA